ncbi:SDR family NAD(P)-dependent oxidoreductase [Acidocella facilis]|uniref:SDR family NAD(P)-dependent oxidoreductase n=1 Tax=Acidocella facilis TaxID=525 RepID=UPI001F221B8D|nr:SDR family NAD(P)-dependent oxidoreductase [Acidocella facilis]
MSRLGDRAVIFGASGAIGGALVDALRRRGVGEVHALSRQPVAAAPGIYPAQVDLLDEASLSFHAARLGADGVLDTIIVATGLLHAPDMLPEKALRDLRADALAMSFAVNCIGPSLVMKHFLGLLPRDRASRFAALSARIGSISDNQKGGWYGYRAAKAGLNMMLRSAAIETARRAPQAVIIGLHPGTVDSALSRPFQKLVPPGQLRKPEDAAEQMLDVLEAATPAQSGKLFAYDGTEILP